MSSNEEYDPNVVLTEIPAPPTDKSANRPESNAFGCGCLTAIVTMVAILPGGCGVYWSRASKHDLGEITVKQADNRQATPSGSFVTLRGTPNPVHVAEIIGSGDNVGTVLLTFHEAPRLVIVCRDHHPLAVAVRDGSDRTVLKNLAKEWKLEGRIINGGDSMPEIPAIQISRYITRDLGLGNAKDARVLIVGETAHKWATKAYWGFGFAAVLGLLAVVGWVMTFRAWMSSRSA